MIDSKENLNAKYGIARVMKWHLYVVTLPTIVV